MTTYVSVALRRLIYERADGRCEYCLLHEMYTIQPHEIDHIYAEKHGGETVETNLCLSCFDCNRYKGSDLASLDNDEIIGLFHPRRDDWMTHFQLNGGLITPLTATGRITVLLLKFNDVVRVEERETLIRLGRFP